MLRKIKRLITLKGLLFVVCSVLIASVALYLTLQILNQKQDQLQEGPILSPTAIQVPTVTPGYTISYRIKPGDTFTKALKNLGLSAQQAHQFFDLLKPLGLAKLMPGDSLHAHFSEKGTLNTLSLLNRMEYWYRVSFNGKEFSAEKEALNINLHRYVLRGQLSSSLSEDMNNQGVGDALVYSFADLFAWDINFFTEPRKGDCFEVLFQKKFFEGNFYGYGPILAARYSSATRTFYAFAHFDPSGNIAYYDTTGKSVQKEFLKAPLRFSRVSSRFTHKRLHPVLGYYRPHLGIDYAAPYGTPVYSAGDGTVTFAGVQGGFGKLIKLAHGSAYETWYGHLSSIGLQIRKGKRVLQGDCIGRVGSTGISTGPHLDYRMRKNGVMVNPQSIQPPPRKILENDELAKFSQQSALLRRQMAMFSGSTHGLWQLTSKDSSFVPTMLPPSEHLLATPLKKHP